MADPRQLVVNGVLTPSEDLYPTHEDIGAIGGYRIVETLTDTEDIHTLAIKEGMLVYVQDEDIIYKLNESEVFVRYEPYISDGYITSDMIDDNAIKNNHIDDYAVQGLQLASDSVSNIKMQDNSVGTDEIINYNVTEIKLATDSVSTDKIIDYNVTLDKMAEDSVGSYQLSGDSVDTGHLIDNAVTLAKLHTDVDDAYMPSFTTPPTSVNDTGLEGDMSISGNYLYVCLTGDPTPTWGRVILDTSW